MEVEDEEPEVEVEDEEVVVKEVEHLLLLHGQCLWQVLLQHLLLLGLLVLCQLKNAQVST